MSLGFLKSFGIFPDILMGKKPGQAVTDNLKAAATVGGAMIGGPAALGAMGGPAGGAGAADAALAAQGYAGPESMAGPGMFDQFKGLLSGSSQYTKPVGDALGAASHAQGLLAQPQQQAPMMQQQGGPGVGQAIGGILQNQQQMDQQRMEEARKRMGLLGGGYGR